MDRWTSIRELRPDESAASAIEYAFLASLIALLIIVSVEAIGISVSGVFADVVNGF